MDRPIAFVFWFYNNFKDTPKGGAAYLYLCASQSSPNSDNVAWDYLEKTGDKEYTQETFLKAAQLILKECHDYRINQITH